MENESVCWNWMTDREKDAGEAAPSSLYTSGEDFIVHVSFFFSIFRGLSVTSSQRGSLLDTSCGSMRFQLLDLCQLPKELVEGVQRLRVG